MTYSIKKPKALFWKCRLSQAEIEETLYERFGDVLLSAPKAEGGWGISAYAIPIGGFLLGGPLVGFAIYRLARGQRGPASTGSSSR